MSPTLNPIGIFLALVFIGSLAVLFGWMFHVPPLVPQEVARAQISVKALSKIIVLISGTMASDRGIELASRLGLEQKAEIIPLYVLTVPLTVGLDTPLPVQEEKANQTLERAKTLAELHNLPVRTRLVRQRSIADGVIRIAEEEQADAIVIGLGWQRGLTRADATTHTLLELLRRAPCEVIIARYPSLEVEEEIEAA